jgi:hypothetical protein
VLSAEFYSCHDNCKITISVAWIDQNKDEIYIYNIDMLWLFGKKIVAQSGDKTLYITLPKTLSG